MRKTSFYLLLIPLTTLCLTPSAEARLNIITGGATIGYDYDETRYDRESNLPETATIRDRFQQQVSIGPLFIFETTSTTDGLTVRYYPSFVYDFEDSQSDIDHDFLLTAYRDFSRQFRVELSEGFIYSDDPELIETDTTSDFNRARRRYWTNDIGINTSYSYNTGSTFGTAYTYRILRNTGNSLDGHDEYDRHSVDLSLEHRLNARWNVSLFTGYTRGLFEPPEPELIERTETVLEGISPGITDGIVTAELSDDVTEYEIGGTVNWIYSPRKTFLISYAFLTSDYDSFRRNDSYVHNLTFGTQYQHTRRLSFEFGAGPSYEKTENFDSNLDYNGHLNLNYDIAERTSISAGIEKGYDQENFSANDSILAGERGLTEFWNYDVDFSHALTTNLTATLFGLYRDEKQKSNLITFVDSAGTDNLLASTVREETTTTRKTYEAGGSLEYTFLRWYTAALRYTFRKQDSDIILDSYDEHRVYLTLTFEKELFRW